MHIAMSESYLDLAQLVVPSFIFGARGGGGGGVRVINNTASTRKLHVIVG